ncbi:hypothetical protein DNTS_031310 [Danionella cerebrum]|uniref:Uncharacterized protein n=1 Tax=Danionella cerebrum TaxID=2873325 RepID=A0A553PVM9_9TELE|nr:hypothetical protein DNTS_031310 [Danionella translucida]
MDEVSGSVMGNWTNNNALPRFKDKEFRLALLVSFISFFIILIMSFILITSCLVKHIRHVEQRKMKRKQEMMLIHNNLHNLYSNNNYNNNNQTNKDGQCSSCGST